MLAGIRDFETLWPDEVLQLLETEHTDIVLITHEVEDPEIPEFQQRLMILMLEAHQRRESFNEPYLRGYIYPQSSSGSVKSLH